MFQHTKLYLTFSKISASAFFLKYSSNFNLDILIKYIIKKQCMCQAAHQASTDKDNLTPKKKQFTVFSWSVHNVRLQSFRYQH